VSVSLDTSNVATIKALWPSVFPELKLTAPRLLLAGEEYDTWRVRDMVVKFPKSKEHADKLHVAVAIRDELVARVGPIVPGVVALGQSTKDFPWGAVAYERARGRPGQEPEGPMVRPKPWARTALAKHIAETLTKVHAMPASKARAAGIRPSKVGLDTGIDTGEGAIAWARKVAGDAVDTFLISPLSSDARSAGKTVVCHADLKGEHIFVSEDGTRVTALIDWEDMTIADPAKDFAGLVIWLGPSFARQVIAAYKGPADEGTLDRAVFIARAGLLNYCEAVLEGRERGSRTIIGPQLAAAFSD
jgi:aminoglycoside phosphotransferase (APT) family kinase protein